LAHKTVLSNHYQRQTPNHTNYGSFSTSGQNPEQDEGEALGKANLDCSQQILD